MKISFMWLEEIIIPPFTVWKQQLRDFLIGESIELENRDLFVKVRYRQQDQECQVVKSDEGRLKLLFKKAQRADHCWAERLPISRKPLPRARNNC